MRHERAGIRENSTIGWISFTDLFLLFSATLAVIAGTIQIRASASRKRSAAAAAEMQGNLSRKESGLTAAATENEGLKRKLDSLVSAQKDAESWKRKHDELAAASVDSEALKKTLESLKHELSLAERGIKGAIEAQVLAESQASQRGDLLTKAKERTAEQARLLAALRSEQTKLLEQQRAERDGFVKESDTLRDKMAVLDKQLKDAGGRAGTLEVVTAERDRLATDLGNSRRTQARQEQQLREKDDQLLKPLETARLVFKVSTAQIPPNLDLDLIVETPWDKERCAWFNPRLWDWNAAREVGMLISSRDFVRAEGTEEYVLFSDIKEGANNGYFASCMLRQLKEGPQQFPPINIDWVIELKDASGKTVLDKKSGSIPISKCGEVKVLEKHVFLCESTAIMTFTIESGKIKVSSDREPSKDVLQTGKAASDIRQ